jgi:hypothetical protein
MRGPTFPLCLGYALSSFGAYAVCPLLHGRHYCACASQLVLDLSNFVADLVACRPVPGERGRK